MASIAEKNAERVHFLLALYELTDGDPMRWLNFRDVGRRLGLDEATSVLVAQWLIDRGHAEWAAMGGTIAIKPHGVNEAERVLTEGTTLAPSLLILNAEEHAAVEVFLAAYRKAEADGQIDLEPEAAAEVDAEVRTIEAQNRSPKPKRRIIRLALQELHILLSGAGGNAVYAALDKLLHIIG